MFKYFWPSYKQFKSWSMPSRLTFLGAVLSIVSIVITILFQYMDYSIDSEEGFPTQHYEPAKELVDENSISGLHGCNFIKYDSLKVLILSFNDFRNRTENKNYLESLLRMRISELENDEIIKKNTNKSIEVCLLNKAPESYDSAYIRSVGEDNSADIVIYGELYDLLSAEANETKVRFMILPGFNRDNVFQGNTELKRFRNWSDVIESELFTEIDYVIYWIISQQQSYEFDPEAAKKITDFMVQNFPSDYFNQFKESLSLQFFFKAAKAWVVDENFELSNSLLLTSIEYDPQSVLSYTLLGIINARGPGITDDAVRYFLKCLELDTGNILCNAELAQIYLNEHEDVEKAKSYALAVIEKDASTIDMPSVAMAYAVLGIVDGLYASNYESAKVHFRKSLEIDPNSFLANYGYSFTMYREDRTNEDAIPPLKNVIKIDSEFTPAYHAIASIYTYNNRYDDAIRIFKDCLKSNPQDHDTYFMMAGIAFNLQNDYVAGRKYFEKAIELKPDSAKYHFHFAVELERHLNESDLAKHHYKEAKKLDPEFKGVWSSQ